ncbi:MAG: nucleoside recognition domain-containing protein [Gammaproteobacteria bacterium]
MNGIFYGLVLLAFLFGACQELNFFSLPFVQEQAAATGLKPQYMHVLGQGMMESAKNAVQVCISLAGSMSIFLGVLKVAEAGGLLQVLTRWLRPFLVMLFPNIPPHHPALGAISLNFAANALGLGNASTPLGIRAMHALDQLNPKKGQATREMILFLAINTASITLLPMSVIALRSVSGSQDPAGIVGTTLFASCCSTIAAILAVKFLLGYQSDRSDWGFDVTMVNKMVEAEPQSSWLKNLSLFLALSAMIYLFIKYPVISAWVLPVFVMGMLSFGALKKIAVYEHFIEGAKEGIDVAFKLLPYLIAILMAVGMFRASYALDFISLSLKNLFEPLGLPAISIPMALIRPLSGMGAKAYMISVFEDPSFGPDSYAGYLVSTMMGCSETTFYIIAVYCSAIGLKKVKQAIIAGLLADFAGVLASVVAVQYYYYSILKPGF